MTDALPGWVAELYDELLADMLLRRADVAGEIAFLTDRLRLRPGMRLLDQGCGIGSLAVPLAGAGMDVTGIDQSAAYVAEARAAAAAAGVAARFEQADARSYRPDRPMDAVVSWWTSWGHAADDAGNLRMLRRAATALAAGGRLLLDTMNGCGVLRGFRPEVTTSRTVPRLGGTVELTRRSRLDLAAGTLVKDWTYCLPDGSRVRRHTSMRLYQPSDVSAMLQAAGFVQVELLGSTAGEALGPDSPRLIAVAQVP